MGNNQEDVPVTVSEDDVRAGVTGHHVRYVLAFGLAGIIIAFATIGIYFGYGRLSETISQTLSHPVAAIRNVAPYVIIIVLAAIATVLLLSLWNIVAGRSESTSQTGMRIRVVVQFVAICVVMTILYLYVS